MYCVPDKQIQILSLILEFHERSMGIIKMGAPLMTITALPVRERLARLKSEIKNDDRESFIVFEREMRDSLEALERKYKTKEAVL
jgi:V/A-type H+-transporting ATPase subunit A